MHFNLWIIILSLLLSCLKDAQPVRNTSSVSEQVIGDIGVLLYQQSRSQQNESGDNYSSFHEESPNIYNDISDKVSTRYDRVSFTRTVLSIMVNRLLTYYSVRLNMTVYNNVILSDKDGSL